MIFRNLCFCGNVSINEMNMKQKKQDYFVND